MKYRHYLLLAGIVAAAGGRVEAADNVVLFIGDGMGSQHVRAGRAYVNGNTGTLRSLRLSGTRRRR